MKRYLVALCAAMLALSLGAARSLQPQEQPAEVDLDKVIAVLQIEAERAMKKHALPRQEPSINKDFPGPVNQAMLVRELMRRQILDDFVDAYIRWQLTSFQPQWPGLDRRELARFSEAMPRMMFNPRSNPELIDEMYRVVLAGQLDEKQVAATNAMLNDLAAKSAQAAELNRPALGLRAWVIEQVGEGTPEGLMLRLERLLAMIGAGWDIGEIKADMEQYCARCGKERMNLGDIRQEFSFRSKVLKQVGRPFITSARIVEKSLAVEYDDAAVYDFEVRRWEKLLEHPEERTPAPP